MEQTKHIEILVYLSWSAFDFAFDPLRTRNRPFINAVGLHGFYVQTHLLRIPPAVGFFSSNPSARRGAEACFFLRLMWMWMSVLILTLLNHGALEAEIRRLQAVAVFGTVFFWVGLCLVSFKKES